MSGVERCLKVLNKTKKVRKQEMLDTTLNEKVGPSEPWIKLQDDIGERGRGMNLRKNWQDGEANIRKHRTSPQCRIGFPSRLEDGEYR